jgi:hypothetical protein
VPSGKPYVGGHLRVHRLRPKGLKDLLLVELPRRLSLSHPIPSSLPYVASIARRDGLPTDDGPRSRFPRRREALPEANASPLAVPSVSPGYRTSVLRELERTIGSRRSLCLSARLPWTTLRSCRPASLRRWRTCAFAVSTVSSARSRSTASGRQDSEPALRPVSGAPCDRFPGERSSGSGRHPAFAGLRVRPRRALAPASGARGTGLSIQRQGRLLLAKAGIR